MSTATPPPPATTTATASAAVPSSPKKMKPNTPATDLPPAATASAATANADHCQHFVQRKKRFCKMTVGAGRQFCGEHTPQATSAAHEDAYIAGDKRAHRIPCPLDAKHTVFAWNVERHLKICNAKASPIAPAYIVSGLNLGAAIEAADGAAVALPPKLSAIEDAVLQAVVAKVERLYAEHRIETEVGELHATHDSMRPEIERDFYGPEALKHLRQTSAILGCLQHFGLLEGGGKAEEEGVAPVATSYVEFGAGKGHLSYWLAQLVKNSAVGSNVVLVDRASHRHKQDNKVEERDLVHRIRADIADFDVRQLPEAAASGRLVGVSKHLCGAATDLAVRCMRQDAARMEGLVIALCCHHRCEWRPFVGKGWLERAGVTSWEFAVIAKLVSWAVCGTGMSRETRRAVAERAVAVAETAGNVAEDVAVVAGQGGQEEAAVAGREEPKSWAGRLSREERQLIGRKCKRVLDFARVDYLRRDCGLEASLHYYIGADVTLENVCLVARRKRTTK